MKSKHFYSSLVVAMGLSVSLSAQHLGCGTSHADQQIGLERMFMNRARSAELMQGAQMRDGLMYIPVQFHLVSSDGVNFPKEEDIYSALCGINADLAYLNMEFRFYMNGPLRYIVNTLLYNHEASSGDLMAHYFMGMHKVNGIPNIFVGRSSQANDEFAAYYTGNVDAIYCFKNYANDGSATLTHELGHYFTLAHTFYGWEGTSYNDQKINGKAPGIIGNSLVEKVARPGQGKHENCQEAADGFCDTPADYITQYDPAWLACDFSSLANTRFDQDSVPIYPSTHNIMSYFQCETDTFTLEQQAAMTNDIYARGYDALPDPVSMQVTGAATLEYPTANAPALYNDLVQFRWQAAPGAVRYLVTVGRYFNGSILGTPQVREVEGTNTWFTLEPNREYIWTVRPITDIDVCSEVYETSEIFMTMDWEVGVPQTLSSVLEWKVSPNPVSIGHPINLEINTKTHGEATLSLYNAVGQQVVRPQTIFLNQGYNMEHISTDLLSEGMYVAILETAEGRLTQKVVIQR